MRVGSIQGVLFGANIAYLWGTLNRNSTNSYSDSYVNTLSKNYTAQVKSYKADFGVQYTYPIDRKNELTLGLALFSWTHVKCRIRV